MMGGSLKMWPEVPVATERQILLCRLLHRRHHSQGSDTHEGATYRVRWCRRCGVTVPLRVQYVAWDSRSAGEEGT